MGVENVVLVRGTVTRPAVMSDIACNEGVPAAATVSMLHGTTISILREVLLACHWENPKGRTSTSQNGGSSKLESPDAFIANHFVKTIVVNQSTKLFFQRPIKREVMYCCPCAKSCACARVLFFTSVQHCILTRDLPRTQLDSAKTRGWLHGS